MLLNIEWTYCYRALYYFIIIKIKNFKITINRRSNVLPMFYDLWARLIMLEWTLELCFLLFFLLSLLFALLWSCLHTFEHVELRLDTFPKKHTQPIQEREVVMEGLLFLLLFLSPVENSSTPKELSQSATGPVFEMVVTHSWRKRPRARFADAAVGTLDKILGSAEASFSILK